jgi:hypothetical protein
MSIHGGYNGYTSNYRPSVSNYCGDFNSHYAANSQLCRGDLFDRYWCDRLSSALLERNYATTKRI